MMVTLFIRYAHRENFEGVGRQRIASQSPSHTSMATTIALIMFGQIKGR